mmetsp:Transcript_46528/g.108474  ORF Transcript_46528/g.108474 Transcript_46528/m.108474 type:complete len:244 (+) Transcript_46528:2668-3399(+)
MRSVGDKPNKLTGPRQRGGSVSEKLRSDCRVVVAVVGMDGGAVEAAKEQEAEKEQEEVKKKSVALRTVVHVSHVTVQLVKSPRKSLGWHSGRAPPLLVSRRSGRRGRRQLTGLRQERKKRSVKLKRGARLTSRTVGGGVGTMTVGAFKTVAHANHVSNVSHVSHVSHANHANHVKHVTQLLQQPQLKPPQKHQQLQRKMTMVAAGRQQARARRPRKTRKTDLLQHHLPGLTHLGASQVEGKRP